MIVSHPLVVALARVVNAVFFLSTAAYATLNVSSFAYYQFIRPGVVSWLRDFVAMNHQLFWLALLITAATLTGDLVRRRWSAWGYVAASIVLGSWLIVNPVLATVGYGPRGLVVALLALVPLGWLGVVDHVLAGRPAWKTTGTERGALWTSAAAAVTVWAVYAAALPWRLDAALGVELAGTALVMALLNGLIAHLVIFAILYLALVVIVALGSMARSAAVEYWGIAILSAAVVTVVLHEVVWTAISFEGASSWMVSAGFAAALTLAWSGVAWRRAQAFGDRVMTPLDVWLAPISTGPWSAAGVAALPFVAYAFATSVERFDWNFLFQKLGVLIVWLLAFGFVHAVYGTITRNGSRRSAPIGLAAAFLPPAAVFLVSISATAAGERVRGWTGDARLGPEIVLDRYAAVDPSFHLIADLLRANSGEGAEFYGYLKAHSTIGAAQVESIDVDFVHPLGRATTRRPHIFLFVIDSLRRDYLSSYNPAVAFTPSIGQFAREGFAFERAYTRYSGTALSMPAMWAGGMLIHKQYISPFRPLNAIEKLLAANGYRTWISMDHITDQLLEPAGPSVELDRGRPEMQYDFCATLSEVESRAVAVTEPVFVHSRSLNLHISKLLNRRVPFDPAYAGFQEAAAAEIRRMDTCFGRFVDALKREGLYDDSVIVLTADHGDSLGEQGRWGHAYTIFPEVMRVPLILHLPEWMHSQVTTDLTRPSFTTDIAPTLYALLGYEPVSFGPLYGEPLFVPRDRSLSDRRRASFLLASSYGSVHGTLRHNGRALYIADAVEGRDYAYDTRDNAVGVRVQVTEALREANWLLIRRDIAKLAALYKFSPAP